MLASLESFVPILASWVFTLVRDTTNIPSEAGLEVTGPSDNPSVASIIEDDTTNLRNHFLIIEGNGTVS